MIKSKKELAYYLECDRIALGKKQKSPSFFGDEIWKFQICMRKLDFYSHASGGGVHSCKDVLPFQISPAVLKARLFHPV